ncbi:helix-turn-helix domain-containing protein [Luteimonas viscosa]|nr:AraC family transcriptional regulator [Luteimonas viscosa]
MSPILHNPHSNTLLELPQERAQTLHVLHANGRNLRVNAPARWITVWLPLAGELEMQTAQCRWLLKQGELLICREDGVQASSRKNGWWLAVCGSPAAWARHLLPRPGEPVVEVFPWEGACPRELRRPIVQLARRAGDGGADASGAETAADMLGAAIIEHQKSLFPLLGRCSGRTLQRRQQTLLRLLRVRHLIHKHDDRRLDLAYLAASASYSPCHLIRSYRSVFGETPSEHVSRLRLERAWRLVVETDMPVCEITGMLGFESQSAFCRAFKNAYGTTTGQARRQQERSLAA